MQWLGEEMVGGDLLGRQKNVKLLQTLSLNIILVRQALFLIFQFPGSRVYIFRL